jgi:nitrogenase-associated protein
VTRILFYEKPGCTGNLRQKRLLEDAGHTVLARNLLTEPWTAERLHGFFGARPVAEWFNRNAPRVKSGAVVPEALDAEAAMKLLLAEPLLIRRPLLEANGQREVGFEPSRIHAWLGLGHHAQTPMQESCVHTLPCPSPVKP